MLVVGTLEELMLLDGDEIRDLQTPLTRLFWRESGGVCCGELGWKHYPLDAVFQLVKRSTLRTFRHLSELERAVLLLAAHSNKELQQSNNGKLWSPLSSSFQPYLYYRVKPPTQKVVLCWRCDDPLVKNRLGTLELEDGKPLWSTLEKDQ